MTDFHRLEKDLMPGILEIVIVVAVVVAMVSFLHSRERA